MGWVCSRIWYIRRKYRLWCQKYKFGNLSKHLIRPSTGVYLLAAEMEVTHSKWSVFLGVLIPRRSWLIWNWRAQIFTTVGCHDVNPPPPYWSSLHPAPVIVPLFSEFTTQFWYPNRCPFLNSRWMILHETFFQTFSLGRQSISRFSQSVESPAKKWGDTEIAERGRSVLVMRARYRSAGLTPHQRGWTDAGW